MSISESALTILVYACLFASCISPLLLLYWLIRDFKGKKLW